MPDYGWGCTWVRMREKVYRGFYGDTAKEKIRYSQARKGVRAVFV